MKTTRQTGQAGAMNLLAIPLVLVTVVLFGVAAAAYNFYSQAQDYKINVDKKIDAAVSQAKDQVSAQKDKDFAEKEKFPYARYDGPSSYGALRILYPKSWSAYVSEGGTSSNVPVQGWFAPGHVPSVNDQNSVFALRVSVEPRAYSDVLQDYNGNVKQGKIASSPYQSPNVPNIVGTRLDGQIVNNKQGSMIIMPMRDKTLRLWTESKDYVPDFDNIVLPNFSFTP